MHVFLHTSQETEKKCKKFNKLDTLSQTDCIFLIPQPETNDSTSDSQWLLVTRTWHLLSTTLFYMFHTYIINKTFFFFQYVTWDFVTLVRGKCQLLRGFSADSGENKRSAVWTSLQGAKITSSLLCHDQLIFRPTTRHSFPRRCHLAGKPKPKIVFKMWRNKGGTQIVN